MRRNYWIQLVGLDASQDPIERLLVGYCNAACLVQVSYVFTLPYERRYLPDGLSYVLP